VSGWALRIPFRDRSDSIAEAGIVAAEAIADPEEREVAVNVISELMVTPGIATVGAIRPGRTITCPPSVPSSIGGPCSQSCRRPRCGRSVPRGGDRDPHQGGQRCQRERGWAAEDRQLPVLTILGLLPQPSGFRPMKVGPDAGAGANRSLSVAAAPTAVLEPGNTAVTGSAGRRKPREHELAGGLDDGVGWPVFHVIQPGKDARRVRMEFRVSRAPRRRDRERRVLIGRPRRALNLTRKSGTCTCTRKGGRTERNREQ
jgi:hypothetical protein